MDLSIVIVNWNSREYLEKCLASIHGNTKGVTFEIVVIDSGSFDGCDQMLRAQYPAVRFLQAAHNEGFAKANNEAFRQTVGNTVLFLNPDTEVVGAAVELLYRRLHALPRSGIVGARLLNSDGSLQSSCIQAIPTILNRVLDSDFLKNRYPTAKLWGMAALFAKGEEAQEVAAISGACLMLRRQTFIEVGLFSEDYFMYAEDVDLCYKALKAGYTNYHVPTAVVVHHGGRSSDQAVSTFSTVMMREATWRFLRKTRGPVYGAGYRLSMFGSAIGRLAALMAGRVVLRGADCETSIRTWAAVLRWALNREPVVRQYYPR